MIQDAIYHPDILWDCKKLTLPIPGSLSALNVVFA